MNTRDSINMSPVLLLAALAAVFLLAAAFAGSGDARAASSGGLGPGGSGGAASSSTTSAKFDRLWIERIRPAERRWARRTADCESGGDPDAIGGGGRYRGAFQFTKSTWRRSPRSPGGDPIEYSYRTQAVVAVLLKRRDGAGHWPACG